VANTVASVIADLCTGYPRTSRHLPLVGAVGPR
jgi:hypothetical protein